jgi:DNA-binding MarR family transcriptional regulator
MRVEIDRLPDAVKHFRFNRMRFILLGTSQTPETPVTRSTKAEPKKETKKEPRDRKLSNFLCFAVYSANLAFGRAYKPILDAIGLTYTQYIAMVALSEADDQTVSALGEKLFLESNTLTPILKKLEQSGYLSRPGSRRNPDRRHWARRPIPRGAEDRGRAARQSPASHQGRTSQGLIARMPAVDQRLTRKDRSDRIVTRCIRVACFRIFAKASRQFRPALG